VTPSYAVGGPRRSVLPAEVPGPNGMEFAMRGQRQAGHPAVRAIKGMPGPPRRATEKQRPRKTGPPMETQRLREAWRTMETQRAMERR
jgi:hypothetical protein